MNPEPSFSSGPTGCEVAGAGQSGLRGGALRHRLAAEASDLPDGADQHQLNPGGRQAHQPRHQNQVLRDRLPGVPQLNVVPELPASDQVPAPNPDRASEEQYRALRASRESQATLEFATLLGAPGRNRGHDLSSMWRGPVTLRRPAEDPSRPRAHRSGDQSPAHRRLADRHATLQDPPLVLRPPHGYRHLITRICQWSEVCRLKGS